MYCTVISLCYGQFHFPAHFLCRVSRKKMRQKELYLRAYTRLTVGIIILKRKRERERVGTFEFSPSTVQACRENETYRATPARMFAVINHPYVL